MLVTLKEILNLCETKNCAVGAFNTPSLEGVIAVIKAAEELDVPVVIQHSQVHEVFMPLTIIGPVMMQLAKAAKVPVAVHLDHGSSIPFIGQALELGFTSVMYDGSALPFDENVANTQKVVAMARKTGASIEAEIGCMGRLETGSGSAGEKDPDKIYTDPDEAKLFVDQTGIDALACSFGTTHGVYLTEPKLDFSVVENVRKKCGIPVVMHGGSGVSEEDFRTAISKGVRKINYYTYMAMAGGEAIADQIRRDADKQVMFHDVVFWGIDGMKEDVKKAMSVFAMK